MDILITAGERIIELVNDENCEHGVTDPGPALRVETPRGFRHKEIFGIALLVKFNNSLS